MPERIFLSLAQVVDHCSVGGEDCVYPDTDPAELPAEDHAEFEVEVPAGKWVTRPFADSTDKGYNFMCHTLIPNVTVNFTRESNSKALNFA